MSIYPGFWGWVAAATTTVTLPPSLPSPLPSPLTAPTPATPPVTPSPIVNALASVAVVLWLIFAASAIRRWKLIRPSNIVGPQRLAPGETAWILVFIFGYGLLGGALVAIPVARMLHGPLETRALLLTAIAELFAGTILVSLTARLRTGGLGRLGLGLRQLLPGVGWGLLSILLLFPIVTAVSFGVNLYLQWTGRPEPAMHQVLQTLLNPQSRWLAVVSIAVAVGVAPLVEELAFRGFLQTLLARAFGWFWDDPATPRWVAVVLTSIAFAAVHGVPAFAPALFVLAMGLGYVYERTGNLWSTITMHATFNAVQIVLFLALNHTS